MPYAEKYRYISNVREEGFEFYMVLKYVAHFYTDIMKGRVRHDSPDTLIKYSRDWEYPWALIRSEIQPGYKALDCGSGYSPLPFIWSIFGAESHAIDLDALICSRAVYALHCLKMIVLDIVNFPSAVLRKAREKGVLSSKYVPRDSEVKAEFDTDKQEADFLRRGLLVKALRFLYSYLIERNKYRIMRTWKSDFWGPIPPKLVQTYGVNYQNGSFTNLPYSDGCFEAVSCISVLEHMSTEDQNQGIKEMSRVLKEGGKLIITYDKDEGDLTDRFIKESGMTPTDLVYFTKPSNVRGENLTDIIGICLVK